MIPKIIYYTWVSNKPFPEKWQHCLDSWKKFMPDYEIREINIDNIEHNKFIDDSIALGKYVIAGHWGRVSKIYETGGIYCDIDIEAIKSFDDLLDSKFFIGTDGDHYINNAIFGSVAGHPFIKKCLDYMKEFDVSDKESENETGPRMFTKLLKEDGWKGTEEKTTIYSYTDEMRVYNKEYFYPFNWTEKYSPSCIKPETHTIHWWGATWVPKKGISVIIPCYNHGDKLSHAIESAMRLKTEHEIIVINDGSTDNTAEVAKRFPVTLIEKSNGGVSSARNAGIRSSSYNIILPLDADDILIPESIDEVFHNFDYDADIVYGNMYVGNELMRPNYGMKLDDFLIKNQLYQTSMFRKSVWDKLGGYWECKERRDIFEDWDFWGRACKTGFNFKYTDVPFYHYKDGRMTASISEDKEVVKQIVIDHIKNS